MGGVNGSKRLVHCRDLLIIAVGGLATTVFVAVYFFNANDGKELIAAIVAGGLAAMAWAFQAANLRFGAADIFASEIVTLCRICRVIDFIPRLLAGYEPGGKSMHGGQTTQDYVVIFHNNSKDLEILDSNVVNWVTEFYVYFKAMLDTLSRLPSNEDDKRLSSEQDGPYKETLLNAIYHLYGFSRV